MNDHISITPLSGTWQDAATITHGIAGTITGTTGTVASYGTLLASPTSIDDLMERHEFNRVTVAHKVATHELMKLKEVTPTYAEEIKENLAKNSARDIVKKMTFTKKHDVDADVHHFIGRVWVFTNEELIALLKEAQKC
jgi:hypothetical protein